MPTNSIGAAALGIGILIAGLLSGIADLRAQTNNATWIGDGADSLFSNPDNWQGGLLPNNNGQSSVNFGDVTNRTVTLDADWEVGQVVFNSAAGAYTIGTSNGSILEFLRIHASDPVAVHTFDLDLKVSDYAINNGLTPRIYTWDNNFYNAVEFNGDIDNNGADIEIQSRGPKNFNGNIFGAGGLFTQGYSFASFYAANTFTGDVRIQRGGFRLYGDNGGFLGTTSIVVTDVETGDRGTLTAGEAAATVANPNRINDAATVALRHGEFVLTGSDNAATASEVIDTLSIQSGANELQLVNAGATREVELVTTSAVDRQAGGFLWVTGPNLGSTGPNSSRVMFGSAPALLGGGGAAGTTSVSILPWAFSQSSAQGFVTYDANGLRILDTTTEYRTDFLGGINDNVRLSGNESLSGDAAVNALWHQGSNELDIGAGNTLDVGSGALLLASSSSIVNGSIDFGAATGVIAINGGTTGAAEISSAIHGTGGLETNARSHFSSYGQSALRLSGVSDYTGTTRLGTQTTITNANALGASGGDVILDFGGAVLFDGSFTLQKDITVNQRQSTATPGPSPTSNTDSSLDVLAGDAVLDGDFFIDLNEPDFPGGVAIQLLEDTSLDIQGTTRAGNGESLTAEVATGAGLTFSGTLSSTEKLGGFTKRGAGSLTFEAASAMAWLNIQGGVATIQDAVFVDTNVELANYNNQGSEILLDGVNASLTAGGSFTQRGGTSMVAVSNGAQVSFAQATQIGTNNGTNAEFLVTGAGSHLDVTNVVYFGLGGGNGTLTAEAGATVETFDLMLGISSNGTGTVEVADSGSSLTATNVYVGGSSTTSAGTGILTVRDGGTLVTSGANGVRVYENGTLTGGGGLITGDVTNWGTVAPGNSPGTMTISGDYTQEAAGLLEIELGGTGPGLFDLLVVTGDASLDGTLTVDLVSSFSLTDDQFFQIVEVTGTFSGQFTGLGEGGLVGNFGGTDLFITYAPELTPNSSTSGVALYTIPEPSGGLLVLMAAGGWLMNRRVRGRPRR